RGATAWGVGWGGGAPGGELSGATARVTAVRTRITSGGAWRRTASERHAAACAPSMTQARVPGWRGHQVAPASVIPVSSSTKQIAIVTSTAILCLQNHLRTVLPALLRGAAALQLARHGMSCSRARRVPANLLRAGKPTKVAGRPPRPAVRGPRIKRLALPWLAPAAVPWTHGNTTRPPSDHAPARPVRDRHR